MWHTGRIGASEEVYGSELVNSYPPSHEEQSIPLWFKAYLNQLYNQLCLLIRAAVRSFTETKASLSSHTTENYLLPYCNEWSSEESSKWPFTPSGDVKTDVCGGS